MIELKPRCAGCGTANAIDAIFCQECGCGLNPLDFETDDRGFYIGKNDDHRIYDGSYDDIGFQWNNGKYEISDVNNKILFKNANIEEAREQLRTIKKTMNGAPNPHDYPYPVVRDERGRFIPATQDHIDNLEYAKKIKIPLDYLRIEPPNPKKQFIVQNDEGISKHGRIEGRNILKVKAINVNEAMKKADWDNLPPIPTETMQPPFQGIIKIPNARPEHLRRFMEAYKGEMEKAAKDPYYIPLIATNKDITPLREKSSGLDRPVPIKHIRKPWGGGKCDCDGIKSICDEFRAKQEERPYSAIIGTDVRKGIDGFSRTEKLILKFSTLAIIISLGILYFM